MQHLQSQQLRQCQNYLQQPDQTPFEHQQQTLQQCCQELQYVDQQCHCKAIKQVFSEVQQQVQQQQQQGPFGSMQIQKLKQKAENLQNQCNLQTRKQCQIKTMRQCQQQLQGRQFDRCQRYVEQQTGSGYLRSAVSSNPEERVQCCQELRNVEVECQCEAMKEVMRQGMQKEGMQEMGMIRRVVEDLKNQCNLDVEQCQLSSWMF
ncbi:hypothetical protein OSB04_030673 [Centaurea solstitialis]|uniref:Bifunctional inhibitor/plant lipid transfer protein/seed storage helical domain-containing protein n=1 Tax=Centaurea solstitialis TaxID=347529 RepID=A0AA38SKS1_9ASTR|nr:hypothetical protein OSB04_030673 [Centaurea solstitialis]